MRLWTIQSKAVYNLIQSTGIYHCIPDLSMTSEDIDSVNNCFTDAYNWISQQMKIRIGAPPEGVVYPVWAWHSWEAQHKRPDMRKYDFLQAEDSVLLEIEIPDDQVLLSDEELWHHVLNKWCIYDVTDDDTWEEEDAKFELLSESEKERTMKKSWENIFNVTTQNNSTENITDYIQATFWELRMDQIIKKWDVKGRCRSK